MFCASPPARVQSGAKVAVSPFPFVRSFQLPEAAQLRGAALRALLVLVPLSAVLVRLPPEELHAAFHSSKERPGELSLGNESVRDSRAQAELWFAGPPPHDAVEALPSGKRELGFQKIPNRRPVLPCPTARDVSVAFLPTALCLAWAQKVMGAVAAARARGPERDQAARRGSQSSHPPRFRCANLVRS